MGGGLMQLVAYGAQDIYLTGNPQITFFKVVYRRHTNFAMEVIEQTLSGANTTAGGSGTCTISRNGDLVGRVYVTSSGANIDNGDAIVNQVDLEIGGQLIDRQYGQWMNIWSELSTPDNKMKQLRHMVNPTYVENNNNNSEQALDGDDYGKLTASGTYSSKVYIPLKFFFCENPGLALPLIALQYHEVKLNFTFASDADLDKFGMCGSDPVGVYGACCGSNNIKMKSASLWCDYVYLDTDERRRFAQTSHEYLITQVQHSRNNTVSGGETNVNLNLNFNHPVKELVWVVESNYGEDRRKGANKLNYWNNYCVGVDQVESATLHLNGHERFARRNGSYFRKVQRFQHHTGSCSVSRVINQAVVLGCQNGKQVRNYDSSSPTDDMGVLDDTRSGVDSFNSCIYMYSFAISPEEHQPSGTCNFSRIDSAILKLTLNKSASMGELKSDTSGPYAGKVVSSSDEKTRAVSVYGINYNVLRIMSGMGGLAYSN